MRARDVKIGMTVWFIDRNFIEDAPADQHISWATVTNYDSKDNTYELDECDTMLSAKHLYKTKEEATDKLAKDLYAYAAKITKIADKLVC